MQGISRGSLFSAFFYLFFSTPQGTFLLIQMPMLLPLQCGLYMLSKRLSVRERDKVYCWPPPQCSLHSALARSEYSPTAYSGSAIVQA